MSLPDVRRQPPDHIRELTQRVFALQRELLFRARAVIFTRLADLGGLPTWREECHETQRTARVGEWVARSIGASRMTTPFMRFPPEAREYWRARGPSVFAFGVRTHVALTRLAPRAEGDERMAGASGLFQLAASLLDWIGDEDGGGDEIRSWLPVGELGRLHTMPSFRREVVAASQRDARPAIAAFIALLCALVERAADSGRDIAPLLSRLGEAYDVELESFDSRPSVQERMAIARAKSVAPTFVVGELACLDVRCDARMFVSHATTLVAPIFSIVDDLADLTADVRVGHSNTIRCEATPLADDQVMQRVRELLATDDVERLAGDVADAVHALDQLLRDAAVDTRRRDSSSRWLRTIIWQWLS